MDDKKWTQFVRKIHIKASIEEIYKCWTTSHELEKWFLKKASFKTKDGILREPKEEFQAEDTYTWEWYNWDGEESGEILDVNGKDQIILKFADNTVEILLSKQKDMTLVHLRQYNINTEEKSKMTNYVGCSNGWTFWLTNLKAYLEHNIFLHNKEENTPLPSDGFEYVNI